ncbi:bifunctional FCP1 homology domain/Dullard phosphatase domain [Babesia duncani]|uniref:Bifunctional FCP1 homology domain/Dullard phosphatase domain n=1 Tax=Babesia duncani TaxID=323732 RepID=A0AAD9PIK1_9APIC|nr:bifunctional FCP1 homology domain/Dullard phosphatase domain [Babesia duncani]KAK2195058.1 bifunctional FCP1 homology domain/Dullard phosphatase domain [Babesia duncani]
MSSKQTTGDAALSILETQSHETSMALSINSQGVTRQKKLLVLDLDETLIHSSFEKNGTDQFVIELAQDGTSRTVYVAKRPFVDEFLLGASQFFEIVIFTAGLEAYADPVVDILDVNKVISRRFFRQDCAFWNGLYIKDLVIFNRPLSDIVIIDNTPSAYCLQPNNAIAIESWYEDPNDVELLKLLPLLSRLAYVDDVAMLLYKQPCSPCKFLEEEIVDSPITVAME